MPLTDDFVNVNDVSTVEFLANIEIYQCLSCGLVQNQGTSTIPNIIRTTVIVRVIRLTKKFMKHATCLVHEYEA